MASNMTEQQSLSSTANFNKGDVEVEPLYFRLESAI